MKKAIVDIDTNFLAALLQLPSEAEIEDVMMSFEYPGRLMLKLRNVGEEVSSNHVIQHHHGIVDQTTEKIDWGFDEQV